MAPSRRHICRTPGCNKAFEDQRALNVHRATCIRSKKAIKKTGRQFESDRNVSRMSKKRRTEVEKDMGDEREILHAVANEVSVYIH